MVSGWRQGTFAVELLSGWVVVALCALVAVLWLAPGQTGQAAPPTMIAASPPQAADTDKPVPLPERMSKEEARDFLSRLTDREARALLLAQLEKQAPPAETAPAAPDSLLFRVQADMYVLRGRLREMLAAIPELSTIGPTVVMRITKGYDRDHAWRILASMLIILAVAWAGERVACRLFRPLLRRLPAIEARSDFGKLGVLLLRSLVTLFGITVFAVLAITVFFFVFKGHEAARVAFWSVFAFLLVVRIGALLLRLLLAPNQPDLRLPAVDDHTATRLYRSFMVLLTLGAASILGAAFLNHLGLAPALMLLVGEMVLILNVIAIITVIATQHEAIGRLVGLHAAASGEEARGWRSALGGYWHLFAIFLILAIGVFATADRLMTGEMQLAHTLPSLAILIAALLADGLLRMAVRRFFAPPSLQVATAPADTALSGYEPVIVRNGRILVAVLVAVLLADIWDINLQALAAYGLGGRIADSLFDIVITLLLASAGWGIVKTAINRHLPHERLDALALVEDEALGTGLTRLETLLPLLRKFLFITLLVTVSLIVISALGINIGPLLAGAGVIGIAVGFGAQTLVRDIISGVFFLIDDAFRVGEYIDVGEGKGTVERMSVRSLMLRHHLGQINTIPFGVIRRVTNYSRDWAIMKLEVRVPFDTDLEKVRKIVKQVGKEMMADPEYGANFIQPLKSQGVHRMDDSSFIVRVKFMAKPGEQFVLRREVFRRIQEAFQQNGIKFAPRRVIVDAPPAIDSAAAAAIAAEAAIAPGEAAPAR